MSLPFRFTLRQRVRWRDAPSMHPDPWVIVGRLYHERVQELTRPGDHLYVTYEIVLATQPQALPAGVLEDQLAPWPEEAAPPHAALRCQCGAVVLQCRCMAPWRHAPWRLLDACGVCTATGGVPVETLDIEKEG